MFVAGTEKSEGKNPGENRWLKKKRLEKLSSATIVENRREYEKEKEIKKKGRASALWYPLTLFTYTYRCSVFRCVYVLSPVIMIPNS